MTDAPPLPDSPLPSFGRACRRAFLLEAGMAFVNHGSFGATPRAVLAAQDAARTAMERQPLRFFVEEAPAALRAAADAVAEALGAEGNDVAFVENATAGVNAVLGSLRFGPGDEVLTSDHAYGAVLRTLEHTMRRAGATLRVAPVPTVVAGPDEVVAAFVGGMTERTRLVVVDHVTSMSGLVFPAAEVAAAAAARGIPTLVDGAHAPGMLPLRIPAVGARWYVGNCHKWLFAPKGTAILWAAPDAEARGDLHPPVISHHLGQPFPAEFDWVGTRDLSGWLAAPAALAFAARWGLPAIQAHNDALARAGAALVAEAVGGVPTGPESMRASLGATVLPGFAGADAALGERLRRTLWAERRIEAACFAFQGRLVVRVSAQIYNELADYEALAAALPATLRALGG